jgi:putative ABC transport system permease protein
MTWNLRVSPRDLAHEAVAALLAHRLRALLSAIGIVFGIATVVTALAIGEGARRAALAEIGALGIDNVLVRATAAAPVANRRRRPPAPVLSLDDARVIAGTLESESVVTALRLARIDITAGARATVGALAGVTPSWAKVADAHVAAGRWLSPDDERSRRRVAVIGGGLEHDLFGSANSIGSRVLAGGNWYVVVGRMRDRLAGAPRSTMQSFDIERSLFVPLTTMDVSMGEGDTLDRVQEIGVRVHGPAGVERAAQVISALIARRHAAAPRYEVIVPRELLRARLRTQRTFDAVLMGIGLLALIISGVGIMNIMLASVAERTQEIGIRRAFGARRAEIVVQFAMEAAALCIAGGIAGVPLGAVFSGIVAVAAGWPVTISPLAVVSALALATAVGLGFGVYPARLAANIDPAEALRSHA